MAYTQEGNHLLIGSRFPWARNLRTNEPLEIRLKGKRRRTDLEVFTAEDDVTRLYAAMCRDNRQFAKFNRIGLDAAGNPDPDDLHSAWSAGARAFRLTPR